MMTPEEARKLLDGITPGPWECSTYDVGVPEGWDESWLHLYMGHTVLSTGGPYEHITDEDYANAVLAAAAPELAETVAGLQTAWLICRERESDGLYEYWYYPEEYWCLSAGIASRFASRDAAIEHAKCYGMEGYQLATMLIGSVEVEE